MKHVHCLIILCAFLSACSSNEDSEPMPISETVFDVKLQAMDKAKSVEQQLQEAVDKKKQAINELSE